MMNKTVAIVGSGPSGLQAAKVLVDAGLKVTIFEKEELLGGVLRYGIPAFRMKRDPTDQKIEKLRNAGVELKNNTEVGKDIFLKELVEQFDFVVLAIGACEHRTLQVEGIEKKGVYYALDFLRKYNTGQEIDMGQKAVVIGGGYVAIDAVLVLRKLAVDATLVYRRRCEDCGISEDDIKNAKDQGVKFEFCLSPVAIMGDKKVEKVKFQKNKVCEVPGLSKPEIKPIDEFVEFGADSVIIAVGEKPSMTCWQDVMLKFSEKGLLIVNSEMQTNVRTVYACGDLVTGPINIGSAVKTGMQAAQSIIKKASESN
ncbi:MAG: FAD-dependent oxidoreductase [Candidatus Diapherotrites archaeon]